MITTGGSVDAAVWWVSLTEGTAERLPLPDPPWTFTVAAASPDGRWIAVGREAREGATDEGGKLWLLERSSAALTRVVVPDDVTEVRWTSPTELVVGSSVPASRGGAGAERSASGRLWRYTVRDGDVTPDPTPSPHLPGQCLVLTAGPEGWAAGISGGTLWTFAEDLSLDQRVRAEDITSPFGSGEWGSLAHSHDPTAIVRVPGGWLSSNPANEDGIGNAELRCWSAAWDYQGGVEWNDPGGLEVKQPWRHVAVAPSGARVALGGRRTVWVFPREALPDDGHLHPFSDWWRAQEAPGGR